MSNAPALVRGGKIGIMRAAFIRVPIMLRKLVQTFVVIMLSSSAAYAQLGNTGNTGNAASINAMPDSRRRLTPDEQRREKEIEAEYNRTINDRIPDKKGTHDPWGNVRQAPAKSSAVK